jgi:hypothetical protein
MKPEGECGDEASENLISDGILFLIILLLLSIGGGYVLR